MLYELVIIVLTILIYQIIQFIRHQTEIPKEPNKEEDATNIGIGKWLPKSWDKKKLFIPNEVKQKLNNPILDKSLLYPLSEAPLRLQQNDISKDFSYGWGWDTQNILHIHCNTIFPNATPDMIKFWFINKSNGTGKYHWYKWWHPIDHKRAWYDDNQVHPMYDKKNGYIGHTSYVYEYLCKDMPNTKMDYLRIHFVHPTEFGFKKDINKLNEREVVCAKAGFLEFQTESSQFIHYFEKYKNNSCIMKSRFWIGDAKVDKTVPVPLRWIVETLFLFPFIRKVLIPGDIGKRILTHCAKEMNCLASFLPELYELYHQKQT